nr:hypothetical protein [Streptomyces sp. WAC05292]
MRGVGGAEDGDGRVQRREAVGVQQRHGQGEGRAGGGPPAQPQPDAGGQRTDRQARHGADDAHGGVDGPGLAGSAEAGGEGGDAGLAGAEHGALEEEGAADGVDDPGVAGPAGARPGRGGVGGGRGGGGRGGVQGEGRAEDGDERGSEGQGERGVRGEGGESDEGRPEDEGHLVEGPFEGVDGAHRLLVRAGAVRERDGPGPGERPYQRHRRPGEGPDRGERRCRQAPEGAGDQPGGGGRVDRRGGEDHGPLAAAVGGPAEQRPAQHLPGGERGADRPGGGEGAAGRGDEEDAAELDHGHGQAGEEGEQG